MEHSSIRAFEPVSLKERPTGSITFFYKLENASQNGEDDANGKYDDVPGIKVSHEPYPAQDVNRSLQPVEMG